MTNITVSLDYAKKLRDAGWIEETYFVYFNERLRPKYETQGIMLTKVPSIIPAPTAEEILRELPEMYQSLIIGKANGKWRLMPFDAVSNKDSKIGNIRMDKFDEDTLANAAAAMWIHLKENDLLPNCREHRLC